EFLHGYGLGVLAVGERQPETFQDLLAAWGAPECAAAFQNFFSQLGQRLTLLVQAAQADERLTQLKADGQRAVAAVQAQVSAEQERSREALMEKDRARESLQRDLSERAQQLCAAQTEQQR